jgi:hypothetical protein
MSSPVKISCYVSKPSVLYSIDYDSALEKVISSCPEGKFILDPDELLLGQVKLDFHVLKLLPASGGMQRVGVGDIDFPLYSLYLYGLVVRAGRSCEIDSLVN